MQLDGFELVLEKMLHLDNNGLKSLILSHDYDIVASGILLVIDPVLAFVVRLGIRW